MKVEKKVADSTLKTETKIMLKMREKPELKLHFLDIVDRGQCDTFFFIVMQIVGNNLRDLKLSQPGRIFSMGTSLGVSKQCFEAVAAMHSMGFLHRDLKPANYACGLGDLNRVVYLLDFGIAIKMVHAKNPRTNIPFEGTVKYASLACHKKIEQSAKDDCESLFYLMVDLSSAAGLPWKKTPDKAQVQSFKESLRKDAGHSNFLNDIPLVKNQYLAVMNYLDNLAYSDTVDYRFINDLLDDAAKSARVNIEALYDWEIVDRKKLTGGSKKKLKKTKNSKEKLHKKK